MPFLNVSSITGLSFNPGQHKPDVEADNPISIRPQGFCPQQHNVTEQGMNCSHITTHSCKVPRLGCNWITVSPIQWEKCCPLLSDVRNFAKKVLVPRRLCQLRLLFLFEVGYSVLVDLDAWYNVLVCVWVSGLCIQVRVIVLTLLRLKSLHSSAESSPESRHASLTQVWVSES